MNINRNFTSKVNTTYSKNRKIEYIVIHYTAGTKVCEGKAKASVQNFAQATRKASADFVVDEGSVAYQYNPDISNYYCWSVGGSKYPSCSTTGLGKFHGKCKNSNSISIEMCSSKLDGGKSYSAEDTDFYVTDKVWNNTIELTAQLMKQYNIDINHVIRHADVNGKLCPAFMCSTRVQDVYKIPGESVWNKFKLDLEEALEPKKATTSSSTNKTIPTKVGSTLPDAKAWLNKYYGAKLSNTNKYGELIHSALIIVLKTELNKSGDYKLKLDNTAIGEKVKNGLSKYATISSGDKGIYVTIMQILLLGHGHDPNGIDGTCGKGTIAAIKALQKTNGLIPDGICGLKTWLKLLEL